MNFKQTKQSHFCVWSNSDNEYLIKQQFIIEIQLPTEDVFSHKLELSIN